MGQLKTEMVEKVKGFAPFEQIAMIYRDRAKFYQELNNYMIGGLVVSTPRFFIMLKPVDKSVEPSGQWWAKNPDTWYVRWVAGQRYLKSMFDAVEPLPYVMFRRINPNGETGLKIYEWDKMYGKLK